MNNRPTPETDAESCYPDSNLGECVCADFARKLERERDEAQADCLEQARLLGMGSEREARLISERDDALSQIAQAECRAERFCQDRDEAREALRKAIRFVEAYEPHSRGVEVDQNETLNIIRKALEETK